MASKQQYLTITTKAGEAFWAKLSGKTEEFKGVPSNKYSVIAKFDHEYTEELLETARVEYEKLLKTDSYFKDFKPARNTMPKFSEREFSKDDASLVFKLGTLAFFKGRDGAPDIARQVPIFDAKGRKLPSTTKIGNGSICKFRIEFAPNSFSGSNYGIVMRLAGVQILRLVEFGASSNEASAYGFGCEDDYEGIDVNEHTDLKDDGKEFDSCDDDDDGLINEDIDGSEI